MARRGRRVPVFVVMPRRSPGGRATALRWLANVVRFLSAIRRRNPKRIFFHRPQFSHSQSQNAVSADRPKKKTLGTKGNEYGLPGCVNDDADDRRICLHRRARPLHG